MQCWCMKMLHPFFFESVLFLALLLQNVIDQLDKYIKNKPPSIHVILQIYTFKFITHHECKLIRYDCSLQCNSVIDFCWLTAKWSIKRFHNGTDRHIDYLGFWRKLLIFNPKKRTSSILFCWIFPLKSSESS